MQMLIKKADTFDQGKEVLFGLRKDIVAHTLVKGDDEVLFADVKDSTEKIIRDLTYSDLKLKIPDFKYKYRSSSVPGLSYLSWHQL